MRAVTVNKADGPNAITVEDRGVREPRPGEVRLRVAAAAVNPVDVFMWQIGRASCRERVFNWV